MRRSLLASLLLLSACSSATDAPRPEVLSVELDAPAPLVRRLSVTLARPAPLEIRYGSGKSPRPRVTSPRALTHVVHLTRLAPGEVHDLAIADTDVPGGFETHVTGGRGGGGSDVAIMVPGHACCRDQEA